MRQVGSARVSGAFWAALRRGAGFRRKSAVGGPRTPLASGLEPASGSIEKGGPREHGDARADPENKAFEGAQLTSALPNTF